ncbi:hypothetical protein MWU50_04705 [Flavobacteriaceae bacterium S0862]|nr:hypothetical protein [Flavobacteriaceae bacterium S0862]
MILTLITTYGLFEMQFQTKSIVWEDNYQETELDVYVNYVLELTLESAKAKKVELVRKKLLTIILQKKNQQKMLLPNKTLLVKQQ